MGLEICGVLRDFPLSRAFGFAYPQFLKLGDLMENQLLVFIYLFPFHFYPREEERSMWGEVGLKFFAKFTNEENRDSVRCVIERAAHRGQEKSSALQSPLSLPLFPLTFSDSHA